MDVMQLRRNLLMQKSGVIDTSPIIEAWDSAMKANNTPYVESTGACVTALYEFQPVSSTTTVVITGSVVGGIGTMRLYKNGAYYDYWGLNDADNFERNCINPNTNGMRVTLNMNRLNDSYFYIKETGQILFAGKNSIYYGHRNISELN